LVAGPFTATGASQELPYSFKVFSADEIEVYYGAGIVVAPGDYTVERNESVAGDALEGGTVTLDAGAVESGEEVYVRAVPEFIQEQTYSSAGTRLENLNEALDRGALRDIHMRDRIEVVEEIAGSSTEAEAAAERAETAAASASAVVGSVAIVGTFADLQLLSLPAITKAVRSSDRGGAIWERVSSAPTNTLARFRAADRLLPDGTTDATNGGWFGLSKRQTVTPWMFGATEEPWLTYTGASSQAAIQGFFDFISDNAVDCADVTGDFRTNGPVRLAPTAESGFIKTTNIIGLMRLRGGANITNAMIPIGRSAPNKAILTVDWAFPGASTGGFIVSALGGAAYAVRQTPCCIRLGQVARGQFSVLEGENGQIHGVWATDEPGVKNSNLTRVDRIKGTKCGSGNTLAGMSHTGAVGSLTQYGAVSSTSQYTRIALSTFGDLPPAALADYDNGASSADPYEPSSSPVFIVFTSGTTSGRIHKVTHIDYAGAAILVYPRVHTTVAPGDTFRWVFGSGVCLSGADTNIWKIGQIETSLCGIGYAANAFYNAHIGQLHADANYIVWQVGGETGNASLCNYIGQVYVEGCDIHMLTSSINASGFIASSNDLDTSLFRTTTNPVDAAGALLTIYDPQQLIHFQPTTNINPHGLNVDGLQVVGPRNTGWVADTGTAKKTAHATYTAGATLPFGAAYSQAEHTALAARLDAVEAALQNTSREGKALKDLAITHGLAGA
jgi:hypothetical protein